MITSRLEIRWTDGDEFVFTFNDAEERVERMAKLMKRAKDPEIKSIRLWHQKPVMREVEL